jgi:ATP adenylyltransferase
VERLWSPWRSEYVTSAGDDDGCIFCDYLAGKSADGDTGVLFLGTTVFVVLNAFPYNSGHLMIAPRRHVGDPKDLTADESHELTDVTFAAADVIEDALRPHGFNIGMNLGRVAGAGVPGHLHMHVVPRWGGDTNFMPVVGETKVLPELLEQTAAKLRPGFSVLARGSRGNREPR